LVSNGLLLSDPLVTSIIQRTRQNREDNLDKKIELFSAVARIEN